LGGDGKWGGEHHPQPTNSDAWKVVATLSDRQKSLSR
jgi:hypothetical protein